MKRKNKRSEDILSRVGIPIIMIIAFFAIVFYWYYSQVEKIDYSIQPSPVYTVNNSFLDGEYLIGGEVFNLRDGKAEKKYGEIMANVIIVGLPIKGDLNSDLVDDSAFIIAYSEGDGISYYIVSAIKKEGIYVPLNAVFIGKGIVNLGISFEGNLIIGRYYESRDDFEEKKEGKIVYLRYMDGKLSQIIK